MIDLRQLENSLTSERVIQLVTELGSDEYVEREKYIQFKTICHNVDPTDASLKLYYYKANKRFHCYTECGDNFSIYELFKRRYELLGIKYNFYRDIVLKILNNQLFLESFYQEKYESPYDRYKKTEIITHIQPINEQILNVFIDYPTVEWLSDGISENSMKTFHIKYSIDQNKIIIPHYNENGELIGIRGRALNPEDEALGKYMPIMIEDKMYAHPLSYNLYGLNLNKSHIKKKGLAIVAESEKAVLQYDTMFGHDENICVAVCGSSFHSYQLDLLRAAGAKKILIAFDKEGDSPRDVEKYYQKLKKICVTHSNECKMGFIFDTQNLLKLKDSPFDKGKEVFLKLYKNAIWV